MSRLDLHADVLLDRARLGQLTAEERALLAAHCATCPACRAELSWIEDGVHREAPNADDRARGAAAVDALLGASAHARPKERARLGFWKTTAAVSAGLLIASGAAALYSEVRALREIVAEVMAPQKVERAEGGEKRKPGRPRVGKPAPEQGLDQRPEPGPGPEQGPEPGPGPGPEPEQRLVPGPKAGATPSPPSLSRSADSLFARANAERDAGRFAAAVDHYFELARRYPGARSEVAARVSRGQLLLQKLGRPEDAVQAFSGYLDALPYGPLAEEARAGVAVSFMQLGRTREERTAWQQLLERHPGSLHAERAHQRLGSLPP